MNADIPAITTAGLARKRIKSLIHQQKLTLQAIADRMGMRVDIIKNIMDGGDSYADVVLKEANLMLENTAPEPIKAAQPKQDNDSSIQDEAIAKLLAYRDQYSLKWSVINDQLGYKKGALETIVWQHKRGNLGIRSAQKLLDKLDRVTAEQATAKSKPKQKAEKNSPEAKKHSPKHQKEQPLQEVPRAAIVAVAKILIETELGVELAELKAISGEIDLLISAKRLGCTPRIVVDTRP